MNSEPEEFSQILNQINKFCEQQRLEAPNGLEPLPELSADWLKMEPENQPELPYLVIVDQPVEKIRFKISGETTEESQRKSTKISCPKIKIENFQGQATIIAKLFTNEIPPRLHVNDLSGENCQNGKCVVSVDENGYASFPNLTIMRTKESEVAEVLFQKYLQESQENGQEVTDDLQNSLREKATADQNGMIECLDTVKIGFQAILNGAEAQETKSELVFSEKIDNFREIELTVTEPYQIRISEVSRSSGTPLGGDTVWLRCGTRVRRDQIKVIFQEAESEWEAEGVFSENNVYEQILIIFKTPPFRDTKIKQPVHVNVFLCRISDGEKSNCMEFVYLPVAEDPPQAAARGDPHDVMSLEEMKLVLSMNNDPESAKRIEQIIKNTWEAQLDALYQFCAEADPQPFITACKHLIGFQDDLESSNALHHAAKNRQSFVMKMLLNALANVPERNNIINARNVRHQTPLHVAVRYGDADCVHYLISSGADRTPIDNDGNTTAHYLADTFNESIHKDILFPPENTAASKKNLDLGLRNNLGSNPVHLAVTRLKLTLLESFIEAGAPVNVGQRNTGKTPLHLAVEVGDVEMTDLFIQNGSDVKAKALDGSTPLHWAVLIGHEPLVVRLLAQGADPEAKTAHWVAVVDESDEHVVTSEGTELYSPLDVAEPDERLIRLLKGEKLHPLTIPDGFPQREPRPRVEPKQQLDTRALTAMASGVSGGLLAEAAGGAEPNSSNNSNNNDRDMTPPFSAAALQDDMGSLDFIIRVRLSKLLDMNRKWEQLATALECEHMVEFINVCTEAEQSSSPTVLLLDQYEQMSNAKVSSLVRALDQIGAYEAMNMLIHPPERQRQPEQQVEETDVNETDDQ